MDVDIEAAIREGVGRTFARNGLVLVGIVYLIGVVSGLFGPRRPAGVPAGGLPGAGPGTAAGSAGTPVAVGPVIPVSPLAAAAIGVVFALLSTVVSVGALRLFLTDETERVPAEVFTRRIGWALLNVVVGGVVFGLAVAIGLVFLVVPGVFLMVSLVFWTVFVVDADENFLDGFRRSWRLTSGHRLRLFLLGLAVLVLNALVSVVFGLLGALVGSVAAVLGVVLGQVGGAFTSVFTLAAVAATYRQLVGQGTADTIGGLAA